MKRVVLLLSLGLLGGCDQMMCTDILLWGVSVGVTGADTGQPIEATIVIRDGDYVEQLMPVAGRHVGAGERPGTYRIDIMAAGYAPRTLENVEVEDEGCHVGTQQLDVVLERP